MKRGSIAIIGGGASGMAAALSAAGHGARVLLLEAAPRVGRKLLATGNGRCNLSHQRISPEAYHGDRAFLEAVLSALPEDAVLRFFEDLGLQIAPDGAGRLYPYSGLAASVLDVLRLGMERRGVEVRTEAPVESVERAGGRFRLRTAGGGVCEADRVILSAGGLAAPKLGGSGGGYAIAGALGHRVSPLSDALSPLRADFPGLPGLKGIRARAALSLFIAGQRVQGEAGELLFTEYGLSGVCAMQLARRVAPAIQRGLAVEVRVDLLPGLSAAPLLRARREALADAPISDLFIGLFHRRLGEVCLRPIEKARLTQPVRTLSEADLSLLSERVGDLSVPLTGTRGLAHAQVTAGGVELSGIAPQTLASRICPGLYITGELLDVDGDCGGYNLHFAWLTGLLAGRAAAMEEIC